MKILILAVSILYIIVQISSLPAWNNGVSRSISVSMSFVISLWAERVDKWKATSEERTIHRVVATQLLIILQSFLHLCSHSENKCWHDGRQITENKISYFCYHLRSRRLTDFTVVDKWSKRCTKQLLTSLSDIIWLHTKSSVCQWTSEIFALI